MFTNLWGQLGWLCRTLHISMTQSVPHVSHPFWISGLPWGVVSSWEGMEDIHKYRSPPQDKA